MLAIVGSGIAAQRFSPSDTGLQLLENAASTALALTALILGLGAVSGGHFNPALTAAAWLLGGIGGTAASLYMLAQFLGAVAGVILANLTFALPAVELSTQARGSAGVLLSEGLATFGLVLIVFASLRSRSPSGVALAVGAYIGGAIMFTSSTSFANPAATVARMLTDTFAGIEPGSVAPFVVVELVGAVLAVGAIKLLYPDPGSRR